jgi:hypothetical protein
MDILKTISRRNFLGKLLNLGAVSVLLLPLPPILVHARRRRDRDRNPEADWQDGPRFKLSFDFPSKTPLNSAARLRMNMINDTDEPLYNVRVRLEAPEGADWVGGEDSWSGNLKKDDRIGFETLIKFRNPGVYDFRYTIEGTSETGGFSRYRPISIIVVE